MEPFVPETKKRIYTLNLFFNDDSKYEEDIYKLSLTNFSSKPEGEKYKFSIEKLNATLNSNVVYPVYMKRNILNIVPREDGGIAYIHGIHDLSD